MKIRESQLVKRFITANLIMISEAFYPAVREAGATAFQNEQPPENARGYIEIALGLIPPPPQLSGPPATSSPHAILSAPQSLFALFITIFDD